MCCVPDGTGEENWRRIVERDSGDGYRLGVLDHAGVVHFAGGQTADVTHRSYYRKMLLGEPCVSDAVSYTHLDVYKRQMYAHSLPRPWGGEREVYLL